VNRPPKFAAHAGPVVTMNAGVRYETVPPSYGSVRSWRRVTKRQRFATNVSRRAHVAGAVMIKSYSVVTANWHANGATRIPSNGSASIKHATLLTLVANRVTSRVRLLVVVPISVISAKERRIVSPTEGAPIETKQPRCGRRS